MEFKIYFYRYISFARTKQPIIPESLTALVVNKYVDIRKEARNTKNSSFLSARALLSILRLSTALAKLRLSDEVNSQDINEAFRLTEVSQESLKASDMNKLAKPARLNAVQRIFEIIKEMFEATMDMDYSNNIDMNDLKERCFALGFKQDQIDSCLKEYSDLNVIHVNESQTMISLI